MNHKLNFAAAGLLIVGAALGCNVSSPFKTIPVTNSNQAVLTDKTLIDQAADTVFGTEKTGIPQCDEVLAELEKPTANANESMLDNAKRVAIKQGIYSQVRSASANSSAKEKNEIGKYCAQVAAQLKSGGVPQNSPVRK
jgi:hypothetical protein